MARVLDVQGIAQEVPDDLLRDFLYECVVAEAPLDLDAYLARLSAQPRELLSRYIVHRLAEVDPGYIG